MIDLESETREFRGVVCKKRESSKDDFLGISIYTSLLKLSVSSRLYCIT